jgi:hypothetical protein
MKLFLSFDTCRDIDLIAQYIVDFCHQIATVDVVLLENFVKAGHLAFQIHICAMQLGESHTEIGYI